VVEEKRLNMLQNPFGPQPDPGLYSYVNLKKRVYKNVQATGVKDEIFRAVQKAFEAALEKERLPLSRPERQRLMAQVMKNMLSDMLTKLESGPKS
jgi:hypothetical protein